MSRKELKVQQVAVKDIVPDKQQPRKMFDPTRLAQLRVSINKYGILTPLSVDKVGEKYLLVDGERRYRVASQMGLKKVPAIVNEPKTEVDRLIAQFHLQEQHEGWSATEKAVAMGRLAKIMGLNIRELCKVLNLPERTISDYMAFNDLIDNERFAERKIPIHLAKSIVALRRHAKKAYETMTEKAWDEKKKKRFEDAIVNGLSEGRIKDRGDLVKLKDAITSDVKTIENIIKTKKTPDKLFFDAKSKGAYHYRNMVNSINYAAQHARDGMRLGFEQYFTDQTRSKFKSNIEVLRKLEKSIEK